MADVLKLEGAETLPEAVEAMARLLWGAASSAACPPEHIPPPAALAAWLPEAPETVHADLSRVGAGGRWAPTRDGTSIEADFAPPPPPQERPQPGPGPVGGPRPAAGPVERLGAAFAGGAASGSVTLRVTLPALSVHFWWRDQPKPRPRHPLEPLVWAWLTRPEAVEPERRQDKRILPVVRPTAERERGVTFGGLIEGRDRDAMQLDLFPAETRYRVPLLDLLDSSGAPIRSKGRGAPLETRLLVGCMLAIRPADRHRVSVRIAFTVGELMDGLYPPGGKRRRRLAECWPKVMKALLRARDFLIPDGTGGLWFPVALRRLPSVARQGRVPALDELVVLDLAPVPGAVTGPTVSLPYLREQGVKSGATYRAYLAARSLLWAPGSTRVPVPKTRHRRWGWSRDPQRYPVLTVADMQDLAFGAGGAKNRTRDKIVAPWRDLPDVRVAPAVDPQTGADGYRLLPAAAATTGESDTGEILDVTGEILDVTGENIDVTGENIDVTGENIDVTGER